MAEYYRGIVRQATPGGKALNWKRPRAWAGNELRYSSVSEVDITLDTSRFHIALPLSGTESFLVNGKPFCVHAGEYLILNPQQHARAEGAFGQEVKGYCIFLTKETIRETAYAIEHAVEKLLDSPFAYSWQQQEFMVKSYRLHENAFGQYLLRVQQQLRSPDDVFVDWDLFYFELAAEFLRAHRQIGRHWQAIPCVRTLAKQEAYRRISLAHSYIMEHFAEPILLEDLEKVAYFSKYYIIRLYRQVYGLTPHQHILQLRIERSKELLRQGYSPKETALLLSFTDRRAFSKLFRKMVGVAPSEFSQ